MNISYENKVALITGAASGLRLATAQAFADSGASVVLADWNEQAVQSAAKGHKTLAIRCDVKTYVPMQRLGRPEEIADAVLWLCSSAASYVTGQSISVDGGFVMR